MSPRPPRRPLRLTRPRRAPWIEQLDEVERVGDRRATIPLLDCLLARGAAEIDDEKAAEVADALSALEDPRCAEPLLDAALDASRPVFRRALAVQTLASIPVDDPPRNRCLGWASDSDPVLRALGVQYLDAQDGGRIAHATTDPSVLVRRTATEALGALVRTPELLAALRRTLRDEDSVVREIACRVALFDEPLEVSWDLLRLLSDASMAVRCNAVEALAWYPRNSVLLALADARGADAGERGVPSEASGAVDAALETLVRRIVDAANAAPPAVRQRIDRWAAPVAWIIENECRRIEEEAAADAGGAVKDAAGSSDAAPPKRAPAIDVAEAERRLDDPETPPSIVRELLARRSWKRAGARGAAVLRRAAASPSWSVRQLTAKPFADLRGAKDLAALAADDEPVVRRAAFLAALDAPHHAGVALADAVLPAARDTLDDPAARPTAGDPALAVLASHGTPAEVERRVIDELDRPADRDGIFLGAIHLARFGGMTRAAPLLARIVASPVTGHVRSHVAALEALRSLGVAKTKVDLTRVEGLDHLDVVVELAHWRHRGTRW